MKHDSGKPVRCTIVRANRYERDIRRLKKSGIDLRKLEMIIDMIADGALLPDRCRDHALKGAMKDARECHVAPDWLLTYKKNNDALVLLLLRTGTHRDVLNIE